MVASSILTVVLCCRERSSCRILASAVWNLDRAEWPSVAFLVCVCVRATACVCVCAALAGLLRDMWTQSYAPPAWRHARLVSVPKKGDLHQCDNWRGIALFDVGKLCGKIIQNQLISVVENEVPKSQCGFRAGRVCSVLVS